MVVIKRLLERHGVKAKNKFFCIFGLFLIIKNSPKKTVSAGVEPATFRLTAECSNQLS